MQHRWGEVVFDRAQDLPLHNVPDWIISVIAVPGETKK
jgi:hypothetical protein